MSLRNLVIGTALCLIGSWTNGHAASVYKVEPMECKVLREEGQSALEYSSLVCDILKRQAGFVGALVTTRKLDVYGKMQPREKWKFQAEGSAILPPDIVDRALYVRKVCAELMKAREEAGFSGPEAIHLELSRPDLLIASDLDFRVAGKALLNGQFSWDATTSHQCQ
ncbi:hypothetical protein [Pannonibacter tanglangensis]|uniref:Uncharacterized protein n=1 Tax=Pannonibacter tanglangensis TaxID=2750084 RepID=A0ABW9ZLB4_9HYPH|nr:hypothetical protein [Pannonibacter sp. XCT-34]NBN64386.1 hypothetical protein [Pannonibacter sp. XCT-34]